MLSFQRISLKYCRRMAFFTGQKNGKGGAEATCFNKLGSSYCCNHIKIWYIMKLTELTPLRRSALAFACLKRGSSFVMVYWCIICSVFALYANWKSESHRHMMWECTIIKCTWLKLWSLRRSAAPGSSWRVWWKDRPPRGWTWCCLPSDGI